MSTARLLPTVAIGTIAHRRPGCKQPLRLQGAMMLQRTCRLPRRAAAASAAPVQAAQKQVFRSFHDMIEQSTEPVLVDFYATWCGPCQVMNGVLNEVAPALRNRVKFVKVDTDKYPSIASQYHIGALPTLILFKNGQPADRIEGVVMGQDLKNRLEYHCSRS